MATTWSNTGLAAGTATTTGAGDTRDIRGVVELALSTGQQFAETRKDEPVHFALVPAGSELRSIEAFQFPDGRVPDRISQIVVLDDSASLIAYANDFKDLRTRLFATRSLGSIAAVIDYHFESPEFLSHRATLTLQVDPRWSTWAGKDMYKFTQAAFAEFLEDNAGDIVRPSAAEMLEVARDLHAKNDVTFGSKVNLVDGSIQMEYTEAMKAGVGAGKLEVPQTFDIAVPVYRGETPQRMTVRLRYRISQGTLEFFYRMQRKDDILFDAFGAAVATVAAGVGLPVLMGRV